ncbi:MAG: HD domain-containing protein [Coprobacillus sp.]
MIDIQKARIAFKNYISQYDQTIPSIRLKIVHTYEVMKCSDELCEKMNLNQEDKDLASLIGLLHDIGRFEQWMKYQTFEDYKSVDHALFSSELLFDKGLIREFVDDCKYDHFIKIAIEQHNRYQVEEGFNEKELLFIHLIRDADKLDNFRVKEVETFESIFQVSYDKVCEEKITPEVYQQIYNQELVYGPSRVTHLDMWLSYIAFIFDLHYDISLQYIKENNWVNRSFDRVQPKDKETLKQYFILKQRVLDYL